MIEFDIHVEHGHRRYKAWIVGQKDDTFESGPTRRGVVRKVATQHLDTKPAPGLWESKNERP